MAAERGLSNPVVPFPLVKGVDDDGRLVFYGDDEFIDIRTFVKTRGEANKWIKYVKSAGYLGVKRCYRRDEPATEKQVAYLLRHLGVPWEQLPATRGEADDLIKMANGLPAEPPPGYYSKSAT